MVNPLIFDTYEFEFYPSLNETEGVGISVIYSIRGLRLGKQVVLFSFATTLRPNSASEKGFRSRYQSEPVHSLGPKEANLPNSLVHSQCIRASLLECTTLVGHSLVPANCTGTCSD